MSEIIIDKNAKQITFTNNGIGFSQFGIANEILDLIENQENEIERLKNELEVSKNNEETYRLEMLDITKRLGLDEETLFDDVKDKAERLNNIIKKLERLADDYAWNSYYIKCCNRYLKSEILNDIREIIELKGSDKE